MKRKNLYKIVGFFLVLILIVACGSNDREKNKADSKSVDSEGNVVDNDSEDALVGVLPYSGEDVRERVVMDYGKRCVRTDKDVSLSFPEQKHDAKDCFIVISKKDYYLYVYEDQGEDTVMLARYDCTFGMRKGNKEKQGDMRTPHCTMNDPFEITQIQDASGWTHDFGDGRGSIKSYGNFFLRLRTPGHSGIGIHGSTNNEESVPGRASEGCIRLKDEDIINLRKNYAHEGMKVFIKSETTDDLPFEIKAIKNQNIERKRHFDPDIILTNEQIETSEVLDISEEYND